MTVIYMDENIRIIPPRNKNHVMDMERWMPGLQPGDALRSSLNPIVWSSETESIAEPDLAQ